MRWLIAQALLLTLAAQAQPIESSGENLARPYRRVEIRQNTTQKAGNLWQSLFTVRVDTVHSHGSEDWTVYSRFDLPAGIAAQPGTPTQAGLSDTFMQVLVSTPGERVQGVLGVRMNVPTATRTSLGQGKWTIAPQVGVIVNIPEISPGTFMGVTAWNESDFAGDGSRKRINQLTLKPLFHFELGDGWFIQTEPELSHDNLTGRWFIPLDLEVGKMISENVVMSLEYQRSLSGYQPSLYQFFEFRTGFFY